MDNLDATSHIFVCTAAYMFQKYGTYVWATKALFIISVAIKMKASNVILLSNENNKDIINLFI